MAVAAHEVSQTARSKRWIGWKAHVEGAITNIDMFPRSRYPRSLSLIVFPPSGTHMHIRCAGAEYDLSVQFVVEEE